MCCKMLLAICSKCIHQVDKFSLMDYALKRNRRRLHMSLATIQWLDFSGEKSSVAFNLVTPSGATYDWDALELILDGIGDAIEAVCLCTRGPENIRVEAAAGSITLPTDEEAQRELALRIFYHDTTTNKKFHLSVPGPDLAQMAVAGQDVVDFTSGAMATLLSALESDMKSPDGNAIVVDKGVIVGRRN